MSLYNGIFGFDPLAAAILGVLHTEASHVPRFRDAYLDARRFELVIYTRTGGDNREVYAKENDYLRSLPGFLRDEDESMDSTYALWRYAVPSDPEIVALCREAVAKGLGWEWTPADRWRQLFDDMDHGRESADTKRAVEYGQQVIAPQIAEALKASEDDADRPVIRIIET